MGKIIKVLFVGALWAVAIFVLTHAVGAVLAQEKRPAEKPVNAYYQEQLKWRREEIAKTKQMRVEKEPPSKTATQRDHEMFLKKILRLEKQVKELQLANIQEGLDEVLERQKRIDEILEEIRIKTSTTDTILLGIPALGDIVAQNERLYLEWRGTAEKVIAWNNQLVKTFQEKLDAEIAFRDSAEPDEEWLWKRRFSIAMHEHGLLQADHWSICRINTKLIGPTMIKPRRESETPIPEELEPEATFPPELEN